MFIRSQDGRRLLNVDNTMLLEVQDCIDDHAIAFFNESGTLHHYMGRYTSTAKTFQVMDKICEALKGTMKDTLGYHIQESIFQMPQDDNVQAV